MFKEGIVAYATIVRLVFKIRVNMNCNRHQPGRENSQLNKQHQLSLPPNAIAHQM